MNLDHLVVIPITLLFIICNIQFVSSFSTNIRVNNSNRQYQQTSINMAWSDTWADILNGGSPRWKVDDINAKKIALDYITQHHTTNTISIDDDDQQKRETNAQPLRILCPLAGDDPFIHYAYSQGHEVTAIDIVPEALEVMRLQFGNASDWSVVDTNDSSSKEEKQWKHTSGKVTLYEGDILTKRSELVNSFDAIYDKDSFGALNLDMRSAYCKRLSEYIKPNGTVYIEVKYKENEWQRPNGPPYHVEKEDIMNSFGSGSCFEYVKSLGEVYPLSIPNMKQTGHILRRVLKR